MIVSDFPIWTAKVDIPLPGRALVIMLSREVRRELFETEAGHMLGERAFYEDGLTPNYMEMSEDLLPTTATTCCTLSVSAAASKRGTTPRRSARTRSKRRFKRRRRERQSSWRPLVYSSSFASSPSPSSYWLWLRDEQAWDLL